MSRLLCVGGLCDGTWVEVDPRAGSAVHFPVLRPVTDLCGFDADPADPVPVEVATYKVERFRTPTMDILLLVPPDAEPEETMLRLMQGYRAAA